MVFVSNIAYGQSVVNHNETELLAILKGKEPIVDEVLANPEKYHLQINFTSVQEYQNEVTLNEYSFNKDKYYYQPASLIKLPLALVSLEMLTKFQENYGINITTPLQMNTCSCDLGTNNYVNRKPSPNLDILYKEMLIMSNNDAYNFFYDFVGPTYFNKRMRELNFPNIILRNRFYARCNGSAAQIHGGITFDKDSTDIKYHIDCQNDSISNETQSIYLTTPGSNKYNVASLYTLHQLMVNLFYPSRTNKFAISPAYLSYFKKITSSYPHSIPEYESYPNHYHKYLIPPSLINTDDSTIKFYSKNGNASGYISDVMFVEDEKNKVTYFVSISMYNASKKYYIKRRAHYTSPGIDFFRQVSKILYAHVKENK